MFIVGAANVGKSAFIRRMLKEMGSVQSRHFDACAQQIKRQLPVESAMPGTTLGRVPLAAFSSGGTLYDTPGAPRFLRPAVVAMARCPAPAQKRLRARTPRCTVRTHEPDLALGPHRRGGVLRGCQQS